MNKQQILKMLHASKLACENDGYKTDELEAEIAKVIAEIDNEDQKSKASPQP